MESTEFVEERRYFRSLAGGAVLCFSLYALVWSTMFVGQNSLPYFVYRYCWTLRLLGLVALSISLLWTNGWKTKEHARLFGLLFLIDFCLYLLPASAYYLSSPQVPLPRPEFDPIQAATDALVLLSMSFLSLSLLMGGRRGRLALVVFLMAYATSVFYTHRVTIPRIQAWSEAHKLETLEWFNSQSAPGVIVEAVESRAFSPYNGWETYTLYSLAFIYVFFLKRSETCQADPSPPP